MQVLVTLSLYACNTSHHYYPLHLQSSGWMVPWCPQSVDAGGGGGLHAMHPWTVDRGHPGRWIVDWIVASACGGQWNGLVEIAITPVCILHEAPYCTCRAYLTAGNAAKALPPDGRDRSQRQPWTLDSLHPALVKKGKPQLAVLGSSTDFESSISLGSSALFLLTPILCISAAYLGSLCSLMDLTLICSSRFLAN